MSSNMTVHLDMNPYVSAMLKVVTEPSKTFVEKLRSEGRITDAEVAELTRAILDRVDRLPDLVQAELASAPQSTDGRPHSASRRTPPHNAGSVIEVCFLSPRDPLSSLRNLAATNDRSELTIWDRNES